MHMWFHVTVSSIKVGGAHTARSIKYSCETRVKVLFSAVMHVIIAFIVCLCFTLHLNMIRMSTSEYHRCNTQQLSEQYKPAKYTCISTQTIQF